ncbi:ATP-binding protein [Clostridium lundense]|uniref:ATP-binding protein n=1 Tax=Clostridium lundense TaxID=319475 RepID=UPI000686D7C9|nr:ATP-binding protein [Clostridium lundense]
MIFYNMDEGLNERGDIDEIFNIEKISLENFFNELLKLSIINCEAERGCLIKTKNINLENEVRNNDEPRYCVNLDEVDNVPKSIVYYVVNTLNTVVVNDGEKDYRFKEDKYIKENRVKSILCIPILVKGNLKSILYLENNIRTEAFNLDKIKMIQLLWAHGVVSIENSIMYNRVKELNEQLEKKVEKSTESLKVAIVKLKEEISQRKQVEKALQENEDRLRTLINAMPDCVCFKDGEGRWEEVNDAQINLFEIDKEKYIGKNNMELGEINHFHKDTLIKLEENEKEIWKEGKIRREEDFIPQKDGKVKIFDSIKVPLFHENGNRKGLLIISRDITKHKQSELALLESEKRYRQLIECLPDGVFLIYEDEIIFCNNAGANLIGSKNEIELRGENIKKYLINDYYEKSKEQLTKDEGFIPLREEKIKKIDGKIVDVEVMSTFYPFGGENVILNVVRDITERKKNQKLNKKIKEKNKLLKEAMEYDKLKTDFFANISHEIKTPINVIFSALQMCCLIVKGSDEENINRLKNYMNMMKQNCYRLVRLTNNLIDITKIDSGYFKLHYENADIVTVVENITMSIVQYAKIKGIEVIFDTDIEEKILTCDVDKIERVMLNLLSNAIKFTESGGSIYVTIKDKNEYIELYVRDTGIGIPNEKRASIFERFIQVDKSLSRNNEGSGIGLSLVKALVEMHGGKIYLNSEYGKGSEFVIKLPAKLHPDKESKKCLHQHSNVEKIRIEFSDIYL